MVKYIMYINRMRFHTFVFVKDKSNQFQIENIRSGVEKANKLDLKSEFERIEKQLKSLGYISSEVGDVLL